MRRLVLLIVLALACNKPGPEGQPAPPAPSAPLGVQTGTVAGRVVFRGKVSEGKEIDHPRDPFCEQHKPREGKVTRVGRDNGLLDVIVRLPPGSAKGDASLAPRAVLRQKGCMYEPRVFGVVAGADLELVNDDKTMHNIHGYTKNTVGDDDTVLNAGQAMGAPPIVKKAPTAPGIVRIKCDVHPWMVSWMVVTDHPYFDATNDEGRFTIKKVPVGTYELEAIHPLHGTKTAKVTVAANGTATTELTFVETKAP